MSADPFGSPLAERLRRWPRRTRCRHFSLALDGPAVRVRPGHWLEPLGTVLNTCYHAPEILAAIAADEPAPIANQGMVLAELAADDELAADRLAEWRARTGAALDRPVMLAAPAWLRASNYVPRVDLVALLRTMVAIHRETRFPWLFTAWPCALVPAPGELELLRALEARAVGWDDDLLRAYDSLGLTASVRHAARRDVLAAHGLARLLAVYDAADARARLISARERWDELRWSARSMAPPVSLRYFVAGVAPPPGCAPARWLGACEAAWQRVVGRSVAAGARGEWVVRVLGLRVALAWSVELGTAMLTGWRPARDDEPDTPLRADVDRDAETAAYHETCHLFARVGPLREAPTGGDLAHLDWLARAWDSPPGDDDPRARRALLLAQADVSGVLSPAPALRAALARAGHDGLVALHDAAAALRGYLASDERRSPASTRSGGSRARGCRRRGSCRTRCARTPSPTRSPPAARPRCTA